MVTPNEMRNNYKNLAEFAESRQLSPMGEWP